MNALRIALLIVASVFAAAHAPAFEAAKVISATGTIEYAFTPGDDAAGLIVRTIDAARSQVLVQAFSFTHRDVADALVRAHRRGLDVQIIADQEQSDSMNSAAMQSLVDAGLTVLMDADHAAAHNKVIVVDHDGRQAALVTGSFNFTFAAQNRNAENVLVLRGNPELTEAFYANWQQHREHALPVVRNQSR